MIYNFIFFLIFGILSMVIFMNKRNLLKFIIKTILVFILFNYSWLFQLIPVFLFNIDVANISESTNVLLSAFSSFILAIILYFIYRNDIKNEFKKFKDNISTNLDIGLRYWFIGVVAMMFFNCIINIVFKSGQAGNEQAVQSMIGALPWMMLINAGILAPWNEELVFRKSLKDVFKNKWLFVLVSGILFGLAHVLGNTQVWSDWLFILPYGSLGAAFAACYYAVSYTHLTLPTMAVV